MVIAIIGVIVVLIILWVSLSYNGFIKLRNKSEEAFSTMEVILKKRYDLIPNVIETVKGYAKHEKETLEKVVNARNLAMNSSTADEAIKNDNLLNGTLKSLFAIAESYPELKANVNFLDLQNQLGKIEDEISASRRYYNGVVNAYNTKLEMFPSNIIAGIFGFIRKPLYVLEDDTERKNIKVSF